MTTVGSDTHREILQQPELWPDTVRRVRAAGLPKVTRAVLTGAGSSAYAGIAIEAGWPGARAIPSTELLLDYRRQLSDGDTVVSLARSGNSPESVAVVQKVQKAMPGVRHVALTSNPEGKLANWKGVEAILLDPRTNDRSLVMTSAYSNLIVAGLTLADADATEAAMPVLTAGWDRRFEEYENIARKVAEQVPPRVVALSSSGLFGAAREASLKMLECTAGKVASVAETYLGLRHGPLSFTQGDSVVLFFLSSDAERRRYELDLVKELRAKKLGRGVGIGATAEEAPLFDTVVPSACLALPDALRTPAETIFAQLFAFHLGVRLGLDPDNPSPGGVINRVVQGVVIYE